MKSEVKLCPKCKKVELTRFSLSVCGKCLKEIEETDPVLNQIRNKLK